MSRFFHEAFKLGSAQWGSLRLGMCWIRKKRFSTVMTIISILYGRLITMGAEASKLFFEYNCQNSYSLRKKGS